MLKKRWMIPLLFLALISDPNHTIAAQNHTNASGIFDNDEEECTKDAAFTDDQKEKLNELMDEMYTLNKNIIRVYTEAGALTESREEKKLENIRTFIQTIKDRNFKVCTEYKIDEIEYDINPLR